MVSAAGLEPAVTGIKIRRLGLLGDAPNEFGHELVLPTGVQPAKSSVESAVPLAPGDGRLVRAAGIEPNTSCLEDRHAAHYATPARKEQPQWTRKAPQRSASAIRLTGSDRSRWDHRPGSRDGGEYRDRTCASRRTRRVSTALPYRSANSPIQMAWKAITCAQASDAIGLSSGQLTNDGALDWTRTSIGPFRRRLTVQLVHERVLEAQAGAAPAHGGFADRRVPVSPRG